MGGLRLLVLLTFTLAGGLLARPAWAAPELPPWLPHYDLDIQIDVPQHRVAVKQRVTWFNRHARPAGELVFSVFPRYQTPTKDYLLLAKTVELLRIAPSDAFDPAGRRGEVQRVTLAGQELPFVWQAENQTALCVTLPRPVAKGESVTVELDYTLQLPAKMGRWGQWPVDLHDGHVTDQTVTFLATWLPVLAFYDDQGWQPPPFIPWHQPFFNEAGIYRARITLPHGQELACSAPVANSRDRGDGWCEVETVPIAARDFAVLCSAAYKVLQQPVTLPDGRAVNVRVLALPQHQWYAERMLRIAVEALPVYSGWFGSYPYSQFTLTESFFGWNGNECAGLVMVDARVFEMPHLALNWVDYLVSHEICHQWWYNAVGTNGYSETFMDEGFAVHFTHKLLDQKVGKNNQLLTWPKCASWLPNIRRDDYRVAGFYSTVRRGELGPTVGPMEGYGHLYNLFSAAYDKGGKVVGLIEERLGSEAAATDFFRRLWSRYHFRILRVADLQRELEEYTGRS